VGEWGRGPMEIRRMNSRNQKSDFGPDESRECRVATPRTVTAEVSAEHQARRNGRHATVAELFALALDAHRTGRPWGDLWAMIAADVRRLQRECPVSQRSVYERLLALWATGNEVGTEPIGPDLWGSG